MILGRPNGPADDTGVHIWIVGAVASFIEPRAIREVLARGGGGDSQSECLVDNLCSS
jgi:hypothetical protein